MSGLPEAWACASLADVADLEMGQSPPGEKTNTERRGLPLIGGAADFKHGRIVPSRYTDAPTKVSAPGDIILCIRATIGKTAQGDAAYCLGRGVAGLRPAAIHGDLLRYLLSKDSRALDEAGTGTTFRQVDKSTLSQWPVPLPPLAEQRRIVAKLDALTARTARARADLDRIPALAARYKQAVLERALQGHLVGNPAGWSSRTLGDLGKWASGGTPKSGRAEYYGGDIPWIRSGDLGDGRLTQHAVTISDAGLANSSAKWVPAGTVLLAMYGATIGKVGLATYAVTTNQAVACLRCDTTLVSPEFAFWLLRSLKSSFVEAGQGGAQPNISQTIIKSWPVRVPPLDEQAEIVRRIDRAFAEIDRLTAEAAAARRLLDRLDQAILAKAFRGELVPQDPADESAGVLLERIRAERAAAPKPKRGRRKAAA